MAVAVSVVVVGVLLSSSAAATSHEDQVAAIFNKLEQTVEATIGSYSQEEIVELDRGISQCNMILKEVDSISFFSPDEETKAALYLSSKQCMVRKMMEFLNLKNETLDLKHNEIEYLEEIKPILDKYSLENKEEEMATTNESYSTSADTDAKFTSTTVTSKNIKENGVENTDHNMEKDSKPTEINSRYFDGNRENGTNVGDGNGENGTNVGDGNGENGTIVGDGNGENGTNVGDGNGENGTNVGDGNGENGTNVSDSTEASTYSNGNMENSIDVTKSTNMENGIDVTKSTEDTSADSDGNMENGIDVTKSTEVRNLDNGSESTEVNYNYSDGNIENYTKYQNESSSQLLDIPTPIFLESLLSKILSGIFGVLILMMIFGTIIGCCFLFKYNCKPFNDDLVPLETSANDDVILEFYASQPGTPVPENCPDERMITTPLLVNQIDNLNPVPHLDPSQQHHLQPPQLQ